MKYFQKLIVLVLLSLLTVPVQAADELISGVKNEYVLMGALGIGILLLVLCILTIAFFLYTMIPAILRKQIEMENTKAND